MSQTPDEDEDQIFSGKALGEDGAVRPAQPIPLLNEVPTLHQDSLLHDPAYEPTVISLPPRVHPVADRPEQVELAERTPPPTVSDFAPPRPEKPVRYSTPDIRWGRWILRAAVLGVVVAAGWVVATGKLPTWSGFSFDLLKSEPKQEEVKEKRVGTPAPTLLVLSDPAGATVLVGGAEVGVTPWAGDNVWPKEPLRVEVRKAGYKPWVGLTMGGQQATLEANLRKR
ncbi:MAG TPA: PEGA domain-containing protein [Myxococcaceae bacterium]|nr:PEGA domain-containing protein [Myxococcaceae bacterium]